MMDMLRRCYKSFMRPYKDEPSIAIAGRWHFCPPGALDLGIPHIYGASIWDDHATDKDSLTLGEVEKGGWYNGQADPNLQGLRHCGPDEKWRDGSLLLDQGTPATDETGFPPCCGLFVQEIEAMRIREADGSPDIPFVADLIVDQSTRLRVQSTGPNQAKLDIFPSLPATFGTVTSVGLIVPSFMEASPDPVTGAGNLAFQFNIQTGGLFFASPSTGSGQPFFRRITDNDLDTGMIGVSKLTGVASPVAGVLGTGFVGGSTSNGWLTTPTPGKVLVSRAEAGGAATEWGEAPAGSVSGLTEFIDDRVAALLVAGTNITLDYDDGPNTITVSASGGEGGAPGGGSGDVQYQHEGDFAGDSAFTFNPTSKEVIVTDGTLVATLNATTFSSAGHFTDGTRTVRLADTTRCILATDGTRTTQVNSGTANVLCLGGGGTVVLGSVAHAAVFTGNTRINGQLETDQTAAATTPGAVVAKMPIYDASGTLVGYVPLYDSIA